MYVILFHLHLEDLLHFPAPLLLFVKSGYSGVTLFFVLSGFILSYNYPFVADKGRFWLNRFARVYPVYALSLVLMIVHLALQPGWLHLPSSYLGATLSFAMLQSWFGSLVPSINGPGWTLSVEAFFYAVFPVSVAWLRKASKTAILIPQLLWIAFLLLPVLLPHSLLSRMAGFGESPFPLFRVDSFLVGCYFGLRFARGGQSPHWKSQVAIGLSASLLLLLTDPAPVFVPLKTLALTFSYGLLILGLASVRSGFMTHRWLVLGGEISYGMYILQAPLALPLASLTRRIHANELAARLLFLASLIVISYLSMRFFETPARLFLRRFFSAKKLVAAQAS